MCSGSPCKGFSPGPTPAPGEEGLYVADQAPDYISTRRFRSKRESSSREGQQLPQKTHPDRCTSVSLSSVHTQSGSHHVPGHDGDEKFNMDVQPYFRTGYMRLCSEKSNPGCNRMIRCLRHPPGAAWEKPPPFSFSGFPTLTVEVSPRGTYVQGLSCLFVSPTHREDTEGKIAMSYYFTVPNMEWEVSTGTSSLRADPRQICGLCQ